MTETKVHKILKEIAMAFLFNQNCFLVATEVHINRGGQKRISELDSHFFIDVCGIGEKYIPLSERINPHTHNYDTEKYKYNVIRGVEVKVSKSDFKKGFIYCGCNYHYLFTPKDLIDPSEVPREVGIVEVDIRHFRSSFQPAPTFRFTFKGLEIVRKPRFRKVEQYQIDQAMSGIAKRSTRELINRVAMNLESCRPSSF